MTLINQKEKPTKKTKEDYGDPHTNRGMAMRKIVELKKREKKMKAKKRVYKVEGMVVTVYGEGVELSVMDAPKEFDRIRQSLNPLYIVKDKKD